jgi:phosphatidylserine/phosphatidylglycerophosphate/cardiolipin synthase-like enzyme
MKKFCVFLFFLATFVCINPISAQIINSPLEISEITTSGFRVSWTNSQTAISSLNYGLTPSLELGTLPAGNTTNPSAEITGGAPAQIYYVQASAQVGTATSLSSIATCITASQSSGDIKVYFNSSVNVNYANSTENQAITLNNSIDDTLIAYINRAQESIDLMVYNLDKVGSSMSNIVGALNQAYSNGRNVRVIYNEDTGNSGIDDLNSSIPRIVSPVPSFPQYGIMHNKVLMFDAFSSNPNRPIVWTGSTNLTPVQINTDPNNVIIVQDQSLAKAYTMEFEEMWGSTSMTPNPSLARFGPDKTDNTPHIFNIGGRRVECYFSPSDGTNARIIKAINDATYDFTVNSMLLTRSDIADAIIQKHNQGVQASVLLHHPNEGGTTSSQYNTLEAALDWRIMNYSALTQAGKLHHKLMFANAHGGSNPYVLTGSHNWSTAAEVRNDENTLIVYDANIVNQYLQEFMGRLGTVASAEFYSPFESVSLYPNPTSNSINVSFTDDAGISGIILMNSAGLVFKNYKTEEIMPFMQIELSAYPAGVYFLQIQANGVAHVEKIVLQ